VPIFDWAYVDKVRIRKINQIMTAPTNHNGAGHLLEYVTQAPYGPAWQAVVHVDVARLAVEVQRCPQRERAAA
jgi:hypothetical protein